MARTSGPGQVNQAGRDQVVVRADVANVHLTDRPSPEFARASIAPPKLTPRRLHGREAELKELGTQDLQQLRGRSPSCTEWAGSERPRWL